ncbi:MAG: hypothetical protein ACKVRO_00565 [Micropepsaceae bacterium]
MRIRSTLAVLAAAPLAVASIAYAAIGDIDFQNVDISLSKKDGRPTAPIIVATNATGTWQTTGAPATFRLRVSARVNTGSRVFRLAIGVPGFGPHEDTWIAFNTDGSLGAREVNIDPTTRNIPSNGLAIPSLTAAGLCAQFEANGTAGTFDRPFVLDAQVRVSAARGITSNEKRMRVFNRTIPATIRCIVTSQSVAEPQRTPGAPQRTPGAPQRTPGEPIRTLSPYRPLTADLGFARAGNVAGCPVDIRQSIRIVSPGPGTAKVYIVKQDNPGVLGAPIYVNVNTRMPDAKYVGVLRKTVRFNNTFKGTYRVLAVNPFGEPVASPWAVLDVKC